MTRFIKTRSSKSKRGAHASRVPVRASRPNFRRTRFLGGLRDAVRRARFSARRRKPHAGGVCSPNRSLRRLLLLEFARLFWHFSPRHYVYVNGKAISTMNKMKLIRIFAKNRPLSGRKPLLIRVRRLLWAAALLLPAFGTRADVVFTNLYSFTGTNDGASSQAALVQGGDGN